MENTRSQKTLGFIEKARVVHGDIYNYDGVAYANNTTKVEIKCPKHGTTFMQTPSSHLSGRTSCKECSDEKKKETNMERYGVEYPFQCEKVKQKIKDTNMERYGVENPSKCEEVKKKSGKYQHEKIWYEIFVSM